MKISAGLNCGESLNNPIDSRIGWDILEQKILLPFARYLFSDLVSAISFREFLILALEGIRFSFVLHKC